MGSYYTGLDWMRWNMSVSTFAIKREPMCLKFAGSLMYGDVIWHGTTSEEAQLIERIQYHCALVVSGATRGSSYLSTRHELGVKKWVANVKRDKESTKDEQGSNHGVFCAPELRQLRATITEKRRGKLRVDVLTMHLSTRHREASVGGRTCVTSGITEEKGPRVPGISLAQAVVECGHHYSSIQHI
ncbi:hypothetical protein Bbelb_211650 [Branchiostoma belcheri]|nr:hypothetical protein Bbelb_211650 [Branchiostoma belcheri]